MADVAGLVIVDQSPSDFAWEGSELGGMTPQGLLHGCAGLQTDQAAAVAEFCPAMLFEPDPATVAWMTEELMPRTTRHRDDHAYRRGSTGLP